MKITIKVKGYDKKKLLEDMAKAIEFIRGQEEELEPTLADLPVIDWTNAPKDAVCHSNDSDGDGFFYTEIATTGMDTWNGKPWNTWRPSNNLEHYVGENMPPFSGDGWKQTLQMRPEPEVEEVTAFEWEVCHKFHGGLRCSGKNSRGLVYAELSSKKPPVWKFSVARPEIKHVVSGTAINEKRARQLAEAVMRAYEEIEA